MTPPNFRNEDKMSETSGSRSKEIVEQETIERPPAYLVPSWEPDVAERIQTEVEQANHLPYMVALVSTPGSGKAVSALLIANLLEENGIPTMVMPLNGYHYPMSILESFPDPKDAIYRRGAPDTFDPMLLARDLWRITKGKEMLIRLPAFDHNVGDPEPSRHVFDRHKHKVVLCEGLYLLHDDDGWEDIAKYFNLKIFMDSDVDDCIERLKIRNQVIPGYTKEEIAERCETVDRANAAVVERSKIRADIVTERPTYLSPTWEPQVVDRILEEMEHSDHLPFMVSLSAIPGSGKTVSSFLIASMLEAKDCPTMVMPHDGYHYPLSLLETFPDPKDAKYRRGAPDTFDPMLLARDLWRIRKGKEMLIKVPGFDHKKGDPEPNKHIFDRKKHKLVLCEGLYLLHDDDGWENIAKYFDLSIFMDADIDVCVERLKIRNQCIPGYTPEEIAVRCEEVDRVNAETVLRSKAHANIVVEAYHRSS